MIDFKEEISKYKPVLGLDDVENAVGGEMKDIMDLLQYIAQQTSEHGVRVTEAGKKV